MMSMEQTPGAARGSEQQRDAAPTPLRLPRRGIVAAVATVSILVASAAYFIMQQPTPAPSELEISPVDPVEASSAVSTMAGNQTQLAAFAEGAKSCKTPLGTIVIKKRAGTAGGTIRIWSGSYVSPYFVLTETPQRIAIPYPAPYQQGHGTILVLGEASGAVLYLRPGWDLRQLTGQASKNVWWPVNKSCSS